MRNYDDDYKRDGSDFGFNKRRYSRGGRGRGRGRGGYDSNKVRHPY